MKFARFCKKSFPILVLLIFSLNPLLWFKDNLLIAGGDHTLFLNPGTIVRDYSFAWVSTVNAGHPNIAVCHIFPFGYFWYILQKLGLSNLMIEKLWLILIRFITAISIYSLAKYVTSNLKFSSLIGIFSALLYLFNTFTMLEVLNVPMYLTYMLLPLLLLLFMKGLDKGNSLYSIYFALATLLSASAWVNPPAAIVAYLPVSIYLIYYLLLECKNKSMFLRTLGFSLRTFIFTILINSWWIVPFIMFIRGGNETLKRIALSVSGVGSTQLFEVLRFMGFWGFRSKHYLLPYFPYYKLYYEPPLVLLSYSFIIVAVLGLLSKKLNKKLFYFYFLLIIGIFLTCGKSSPLGSLYIFLHKYLPYFWIFREPFTKFTPLNTLSVSILFGFALSNFYEYIGKDKKRLQFKRVVFIIGVVFWVGIVSFPLFTGYCIWDYWNGSMRSYHIDIPEYWKKLGNWFAENDPDARVFITPKAGYGQAYSWKSGISASSIGIFTFFAPNPFLTYTSQPFTKAQLMINDIYDLLKENRYSLKFLNALRLLGVKYIIQENDLDWNYALSDTFPPWRMKQILQSQQGIELFKRFGRIDVYKIKEEFYQPIVYSCDSPLIVKKTAPLKDFPLEHANPASPLSFLSFENRKESSYDAPQIEFTKINPTKYVIKVKEAKFPFWLIFLESFHPGWRVYLGNETSHSDLFSLKLLFQDLKYLFSKSLIAQHVICLLYTSPSPRDLSTSRMPSSA